MYTEPNHGMLVNALTEVSHAAPNSCDSGSNPKAPKSILALG